MKNSAPKYLKLDNLT